MNIIERIHDAIWQLAAMNVTRDGMTISCSVLVEKQIIEFLVKEYSWFVHEPNSILKIEGVPFNTKFPYNKIVVWSDRCHLFPELMIEIEL